MTLKVTDNHMVGYLSDSLAFCRQWSGLVGCYKLDPREVVKRSREKKRNSVATT